MPSKRKVPLSYQLSHPRRLWAPQILKVIFSLYNLSYADPGDRSVYDAGVCGRSIVGIVGPNPAGGMDVRFFCVVWVVTSTTRSLVHRGRSVGRSVRAREPARVCVLSTSLCEKLLLVHRSPTVCVCVLNCVCVSNCARARALVCVCVCQAASAKG